MDINKVQPEAPVQPVEVQVPKVERQRCERLTGADGLGPRCPRKAAKGKDVCWFHTPEKLAARQVAREQKAAQLAAEAAKPVAEKIVRSAKKTRKSKNGKGRKNGKK